MSESPDIVEMRALRDRIRELCGIDVEDEKLFFIEGVVAVRMAELGVRTFGEYQRILTSGDRGDDEALALAGLLTPRAGERSDPGCTLLPSEPASVVETPPPLGVLRVQAMERLFEADHFGARHLFEEILEREPGDLESLLGMALLLAGGGTGEEALEYCERVLQAHPMSAEAYCVRALVHEGIGENTIVQRELEKALYLDDKFSIAHFRLAELNDRAKRHEVASRGYRRALETLPADDERRVRLYSGGLGKEAIAQACERRLGLDSPPVRGGGEGR